MSVREYAGSAKATKLNGAINNTDTALILVDGTGYPTGGTGAFVITVDAGLAAEEKMLCSSRSGNNVTVTTRGYDGTTAAGHDNQATVQHTISAVDLREANAHINAASGAHAATAISYAGSTNLSSTNVEAALDELDSEKLAVSAAAELIRDTIGTALVAGANVTLTVNDPGDTITIAAAGAATAVAAFVTRNNDQAIPDSTYTAILWDGERYDTDSIHDTVTNSSRLTAPSNGKYSVTASMYVAAHTGRQIVKLAKNGVQVTAREVVPSASLDTTATITSDVELNAGDYVEILLFQSSGGSVNVIGNTAASVPFSTCSFSRIGA